MTKTVTLSYTSRLLFLSLLFLIIGFTAQGQIYFHNFGNGTITAHPYNVPPTTLAPNLSNSSWTNSSGTWTNFDGNTGQAIVTESGNVVITLTFNVATNFQVDVTAFNFYRRRSNTGPQNWAMAINGTAVGSGIIPTGGALTGDTNVANPVSGLTGTVTVVLTLTNATGNGNFRLDDFQLQGSVTPTCTAPIITSIFPTTGPENTLVKINGSGFLAGSGTSAVRFNGINATSFSVISNVLIEANVPAGNTTGIVSVVTNACEGFLTGNFTRIASTGSSSSELYISEIYDAQLGDGGVIELYNGTANPIDLTGYSIRRYGDIGDVTIGYEIFLSGIVPAGGIYMIGIGTVPCGAVTGQDHPTGFNANDELELVFNNVVIDNVHAPDNVGFSMIRNSDAEAPKAEFEATDWGISNTEDCSDIGNHTTIVTPAPTMSVVNIPLSCENGEVSFSATLSDPTGFTFQWKVLNASGVWVNVTDTGSYSGSNTNTLTIDPVLIAFDNNQYYCEATSAANTIVSNADLLEVSTGIVPETEFSYTTPVCVNSAPISPTPASGFTTGGTYTVDDPGLIIDPDTGEITVSASTPGSYVVTYTVNFDTGDCSSFGDDTFTVVIVDEITPVIDFAYPTPVCATLTSLMPILDPGFTTGGTFTSDTGLTINPSTGEINVSTSTPGAHSIIYTVVANPAACLEAGSDFFTIQITSSTQPIVGFSYPTEVCSSNPPVSPTTDPGFVTGGIFTSDAGLTIDPATGTINVVSSTIGSHEITYTLLEDSTICQEEGTDTFTILITNTVTPVLNFSYTTPVCTSSTPIMPATATGFTTGGTFGSTTGLNIDPATGEINVAGSTPGSYTVTYILAPDPATCNPGGNFPTNITINDLAPAIVNFSYTTPVCPNDPPVNPILPAGFTSGGTFTSDAGLSINPTTGQINIVASTLGLHVITYTVLQNDTSCTASDSDTFNFTVDATAAITPITGPTELCVGETIQLENATPGGTWSSSDESVATVDNNGLVTALFSNFVEIIYTLNNGCASETRTTITVYEIPQPVLQDRYLCVSNVIGLPFNSVRIECGIPNQGYTFTWTLDGNPLPTTTNDHVATELGVYEVTVTNDVSGCSNTASCTVLPSSTAVATATVGEDFNQNQTITVDVTGGSGDYLFQLDYGVPQESNVFTYAHQGEYTITVIDQNGCQDLVLTVFAINYPRYFTPNGDGFNDFWKIEGITDLNSNTFIYDRFGKLVKAISTSGEGWDGTLNGEALPSTDYWFQLLYINRDGINKEFKAHFSLKR